MALRNVEIKARKLLKEGKVRKDFENEKRIYFTVYSREAHSVIYEKEKKKFLCDCKYFSVKGKECSHIIACKLFLKKFEHENLII